MGVACLEFRGKNFCGWLKNRESHESFLTQKFPLYGIRQLKMSVFGSTATRPSLFIVTYTSMIHASIIIILLQAYQSLHWHFLLLNSMLNRVVCSWPERWDTAILVELTRGDSGRWHSTRTQVLECWLKLCRCTILPTQIESRL